MITIEEITEAIEAGQRRGCEVIVLVIPISKELMQQSTYGMDGIYHSVKGAAEVELRKCLMS